MASDLLLRRAGNDIDVGCADEAAPGFTNSEDHMGEGSPGAAVPVHERVDGPELVVDYPGLDQRRPDSSSMAAVRPPAS
jgi:hypothetical protein